MHAAVAASKAQPFRRIGLFLCSRITIAFEKKRRAKPLTGVPPLLGLLLAFSRAAAGAFAAPAAYAETAGSFTGTGAGDAVVRAAFAGTARAGTRAALTRARTRAGAARLVER